MRECVDYVEIQGFYFVQYKFVFGHEVWRSSLESEKWKNLQRGLSGEEVEGVGVMKDKELKPLEDIEASHTLGGAGEGRVQGRGKWRGCRCYSAVRHT